MLTDITRHITGPWLSAWLCLISNGTPYWVFAHMVLPKRDHELATLSFLGGLGGLQEAPVMLQVLKNQGEEANCVNICLFAYTQCKHLSKQVYVTGGY